MGKEYIEQRNGRYLMRPRFLADADFNHEWEPETAAQARERITEVIELADRDFLDIARSRAAEQEVLDLIDE